MLWQGTDGRCGG